MALNIAKEVRAMPKRTVRELRKQYADVFGEATNASNKHCLIKRIARRMQSNVEAASILFTVLTKNGDTAFGMLQPLWRNGTQTDVGISDAAVLLR